MIRRYEPNEESFNHNKYVLHPLSATVSEDSNGMFELEMELRKDEIINKRDIVVAPAPRGEQPFRVYRIRKTLIGKKVYAKHIFYDLANSFLVDTRPTNATVQDALQAIFTAIGSQGFTYLSDIIDRRTAHYVRKNPVEAIIGAENSILNTWGGNLVRDNKEIKILSEGLDRGFEIRLGKNLLGIEDDSDDSSVVTRLYPTVVIDQVVHALPEEYIDSTQIGNYPQPIIKEVRIPLSDEEALLPIEDIYTLMRSYCQNLYSIDNVDKPVANYKVDFLQLKNIARMDQELKYTVAGLEQLAYSTIETLTYAQLEGTEVINEFIDLLEQLDIHDQVTIRVKELDIDIKARVISYQFDCLKEKFNSVELGGFKPASSFQTENIILRLTKDLNISKDEITKLWDVAVNIVTGNKGGYKIERLNANKQPYETLYMDAPDINTAVNVLRINNAGIAGSSNGFNGPYDVAITTDGWIVAERILATSLSAISANLGTVTAGKIQDTTGASYWDLDSGEINLNVSELKINSVDVAGQIAEVKQTVEDTESKITQNANNIELKVSQTDYTGATIASKINQSASTIKIAANHIKLEGLVTANTNFKILADGSMEAKNAKLSGELKTFNASGLGIIRVFNTNLAFYSPLDQSLRGLISSSKIPGETTEGMSLLLPKNSARGSFLSIGTLDSYNDTTGAWSSAGSILAVRRKTDGTESLAIYSDFYATKAIQRGYITLNASSATTHTFTPAMQGTPVIVLTPMHSITGAVITAKLVSASSTGFSAIIQGSPTSGSVTFAWIAIA